MLRFVPKAVRTQSIGFIHSACRFRQMSAVKGGGTQGLCPVKIKIWKESFYQDTRNFI